MRLIGSLAVRNHAELLHESERVHQNAAIGHFAGDYAVNDDASDAHGLRSRWDAEKGTTMRSCPMEARNDFMACRDGFIDDPVHIRKGGAEHGDNFFEARAPLALAR